MGQKFLFAKEKDASVEDSYSERKFALRYHGSALLGILHGWTSEDTKNIDEIVHNICMIQQGKIRPFE